MNKIVKATISFAMPAGFMVLFSCTAPPKVGENPAGFVWEPMPLVTQTVIDRGYVGGEGGQVPKAMAIDPVDGHFLLFGTDVGGIARSTDGGQNWEPANQGFSPRGNTGFAIDPNNINRVLAVGVNTINNPLNGIYLSADQAQSWKQVLSVNFCGLNDVGEQIVFDKSSFDPQKGYSTRAYWSRIEKDHCPWEAEGLERKGGLYRTEDGGESWTCLGGSAPLAASILKVHPEKGYLYAANENGLFRSVDKGTSFSKIMEGNITGLDVVHSLPDQVYIISDSGLYISQNSGETFTKVASENFPSQKPAWIKVSPANPDNMMVQETDTEWFYVSKSYSNDGGKTWGETRLENMNPFEKMHQYLPFNNGRSGYAVWHPKDENVLFTWSTDWSAKSSDAGNSLQWNHNGLTAVMTGGIFNFSVSDPDILVLPTQDYDAHLTVDGGRTWKYLDLSRYNWGGFTYGAYSPDGETIVAGSATSWGNPRKIAVSFDGGKTVEQTGIDIGERFVAIGDPNNAAHLFVGNQRSDDGGKTWQKMGNCDGVYTYNPAGKKELYGLKEKQVVRSFDGGINWKVLAEVDKDIMDIAYDHANKKVYMACGDALLEFNEEAVTVKDITSHIPKDQAGKYTIKTVATDPVDPSVVYVGGNSNYYSTDVSVARSLDAGNSWEALTRSPRHGNDKFGKDGGREASSIRVHPRTRALYVGTNCYGFWRFGPPKK